MVTTLPIRTYESMYSEVKNSTGAPCEQVSKTVTIYPKLDRPFMLTTSFPIFESESQCSTKTTTKEIPDKAGHQTIQKVTTTKKTGSTKMSVFASLGAYLIDGAIALGFAMFFLGTIRRTAVTFWTLFKGFKRFFGAFLLYWVKAILIFLWALLLIIPGILAALSYSMAYYIYADNPGISPVDAISRSKKMMYGHRWKFFCLYLRFIGWAILCLFTCGIGFLWLIPYMGTSKAMFYEDISRVNADEKVLAN